MLVPHFDVKRQPQGLPEPGHWSAACLKIAGLGPYDGGVWGVFFQMFRKVALLFCVIAVGLLLNGCTKCGPVWDDWFPSQKSCKSDHL